MPEPRFRSDLETMPAYKAGATPEAKPGVSTFKISANENPYAPIPAIVEAINKAAQSVQRYPDPASLRLKTKLANKYNIALRYEENYTNPLHWYLHYIRKTQLDHNHKRWH